MGSSPNSSPIQHLFSSIQVPRGIESYCPCNVITFLADTNSSINIHHKHDCCSLQDLICSFLSLSLKSYIRLQPPNRDDRKSKDDHNLPNTSLTHSPPLDYSRIWNYLHNTTHQGLRSLDYLILDIYLHVVYAMVSATHPISSLHT